ncbi:P-loop containing nucleoside triphosphate hydrolase protein [Fimicolochytrium jonesii]|uniref:P-loop containing nucleoside triphosphate hydrolase protein n=1 Tax=Fimicolochytrium jonesii TaxID=1396493 RepID=UPI0022FE36AE|nr:P-loop containing nucleoside triphosphate hydrolase protein [Fimicolochytrium jonesii]KAI8816044.1 P-loop containing nucleoside triphosphate hydrolase protein [Fimicolochytrium jonesii]
MDVDEPGYIPTSTSASKGKGKAPADSEDAKEGDNLPWVEKYRPTHLDELISHKDIISTITRFIDENRLPHLLFYGPPGTGKTSTILACARRLYGTRYRSMALELNASDERGIDVVRDQIKTFASTKQIFSSGFKLIILDEADAMTQTAQNALRRVIEKYTRNVRFCIICNYVGKIIPALQSRCTRFRFAPLKEDQILGRLEHVITQEGINMTEDGRKALLKLSLGDMRRALNILQATHAAFNPITESSIYLCTGSPLPSDIQRIVNWLFNEEFTTCYENIQRLRTTHGLALADILTEIHETIAVLDMHPAVRVLLVDRLAEIEYNLATGCAERMQLGALVGGFKLGVEVAERLSG